MSTDYQENSHLIFKDPIIKLTLQFLDSKSIAILTLISKYFRTLIGKHLKQALDSQLSYQQQSINFYNPLKDDFQKFDSLIRKMIRVFNENDYQKIIQKIEIKNIIFVQQFLGSTLNVSIIFNPKHFYNQKKGLQQLSANVKKSLEDIIMTCRIPKVEIEKEEIQQYENSQNYIRTNKLCKQVISYMKQLKIINNKNYNSNSYKEFNRLRNYIEKTRIVLPNKSLYQNKIYYLKFDKSIYTYFNYNLMSIVLSFLNIKQILQMRSVSKWFMHNIPQMMPTLINKIHIFKHTIQSELDQQDQTLLSDIKQNISIDLNKYDIHEMMAFARFPQPILNLMQLFFSIVSIDESYYRHQNEVGNKIKYYNSRIFHFTQDSAYNCNYYYQFEKKNYQKIEQYFSENSLDRIRNCSRAMTRIYLNIRINYELSKQNIDRGSYQDLVKQIKLIQFKENQIKQFERINDNLQKILLKQGIEKQNEIKAQQ